MIYVIYARWSFHPWPVSFCWLLCFFWFFFGVFSGANGGASRSPLGVWWEGVRVEWWDERGWLQIFLYKKTEQKQKQRLIIYYKQTHAISPFFRSSASNTTHWSHRTATSCKPLQLQGLQRARKLYPKTGINMCGLNNGFDQRRNHLVASKSLHIPF